MNKPIKDMNDLCNFFIVNSPRFLNGVVINHPKHTITLNLHVGKMKKEDKTYSIKFVMKDGKPIVDSIREKGRYFSYMDKDVMNFLGMEDIRMEDIGYSDLSSVKDVIAVSNILKKSLEINMERSFVEIISAEGDTVKVRHVCYCDDGRTSYWVYPGLAWRVINRTTLIGFSIHCSVKGSKVSMSSNEIFLPTDDYNIRSIISEFEKRSEFYWNRDNFDHWKLTSSNGHKVLFDVNAEGLVFWRESRKPGPFNIRERAVFWVLENLRNGVFMTENYSFDFGHKEWALIRYSDKTLYNEPDTKTCVTYGEE